ncbi:hypothetical protein [Saccharolobus shibatae]|uniref:Uncharacterized protein n=1 Tax=Saccharolobus shibatae TaxID=2286 RepID=A0A8F5BYL4_9CREN|nr:hypothetical protein [Saccharolobus shibatae]QXJ33755.1 hypothetical protein J5U22_00300 [Saccharolobus shibatae]
MFVRLECYVDEMVYKKNCSDKLSGEEKGAIDIILMRYGIKSPSDYYEFGVKIKKIIDRDGNNPSLDKEISEIAEKYAIKKELNKDALIDIAKYFKNKQ